MLLLLILAHGIICYSFIELDQSQYALNFPCLYEVQLPPILGDLFSSVVWVLFPFVFFRPKSMIPASSFFNLWLIFVPLLALWKHGRMQMVYFDFIVSQKRIFLIDWKDSEHFQNLKLTMLVTLQHSHLQIVTKQAEFQYEMFPCLLILRIQCNS